PVTGGESVDPAPPAPVVARFRDATAEDALAAVRAAATAAGPWAALPAARRVTALTAVADLIEQRVDEIATLITREEGKPLGAARGEAGKRSEEHTSELQSRENLVCRLLLEKKKRNTRHCG